MPSVYIISTQEMLGCKIGVAKHPKARIGDLQVGCPLKLNLFWEKKLPNWLAVEWRSHKILSEYNIRGEWFAIDEDHALKIVKKAIRLIKKERKQR